LTIPIKHLVIRNVYKVLVTKLNRQYLVDLKANGENDKMDLQEKGEKWCRLDSYSAFYCSMMDFYEHNNEHSGLIKAQNSLTS
jgi:hypothetical protein